MRGLLFFVLTTAVMITQAGSASAATKTVTGGKLHVQARVLPAHTVVVDDQGAILQILSNTNEDVAIPRVYRNSINTANEVALTPSLHTQYRQLVLAGQSRVGVLYDSGSVFNLLQAPRFSLFLSHEPTLLTLR